MLYSIDISYTVKHPSHQVQRATKHEKHTWARRPPETTPMQNHRPTPLRHDLTPCRRHGSRWKALSCPAMSLLTRKRQQTTLPGVEAFFCCLHVIGFLDYELSMPRRTPIWQGEPRVPKQARGQGPLRWFLPFEASHCHRDDTDE